MDLPQEPGLQRRQAYSEYIRLRHARNWQRRNVRRTHTNTRVTFSGHFGYNNNHTFVDSSTQMSDDGDYESYIQLQDIRPGLNMRDVLNCSVIELENCVSFCVICQEHTVPSKDIVRKLLCSHKFHWGCIDMWFSSSHKCPVCNNSYKT